jgi:hypothetical protein
LSADRSWTITAGVSSVTASSPLFSSGGSTPNITIQQATASQNGFLSSSDWTTFNSKANANGSNASGTWGISITGNAETVDGFSASQSTVANNIVVRDSSGYIFGSYINMTDDGNPGAGTSITSFITKQGDNYYRSVSPTNAMSSIRGVASGSWGISITGSAASASSVPWSGVTSKPSYLMYYQGFTLDANTMDTNATGFTYSVNAPYTGPIARFSANSGYDLWLNAPYGGDGYGLAFRTRNGDTGTFNSWKYPAIYGINVNGGGALYATIYYDQNNTAYYIDPADADVSAVLRGTVTIGGGTGGNYDEGLRIIDSGGFSVVVFGASGNSGAGRFQFVKSNSDTFQLRNSAGSNIWEAVQSGSTFFYTDVRSPIFYDSNNTAQYIDPSAASNIRNLYVGDTGSSWSDPGGWGTQLHVSNGPHSIIRVYARNEGIETGIFSHIGGQSKAGSLSNHNFSIVRNFADRMTFYSGYTYSNGYFEAADSLRSPIFYDSNNTEYYLNPAGLSKFFSTGQYVLGLIHNKANGDFEDALYLENILSGQRVQIGMSTNDSDGQHHRVSLRAYKGSGTYEGVFGIAVRQTNGQHIQRFTLNSAGSVVIDGALTTTNVNAPSGYVSNSNPWGTANSAFFPNGITTAGGTNWIYGSNTYIGNAPSNGSGHEFFSSGSSYSTGNMEANGSMRAPIFYDRNDTGYYGDFSSTSDNAIRVRGGALHGPNLTWGAYLLVGGDGRNNYINTSTASVCTTNGNLHLDSGSGSSTYINYYDGDTVYFGNGANSLVSSINNDGSHRAQIFYDYNNTAFYLDPNSTGISSNNAGGAVFRNIQISSASFTDTIQNVSSGGNIWLNYGHNGPVGLGYGGGLTTAYTGLAVNGTSSATGDMRAPIFYDSNDTGYYINPNSDARLYALVVGYNTSSAPGVFRVAAGHGDTSIRLTAQGLGPGTSPTMQWWVSEPNVSWEWGGFGYNVTNDGGSPGGFGRVNTSWGQAYMRFSTDGNWYFYNTNTSGTRTQSLTLGSGGQATFGGDVRSPIYYDSNDTTYYLDPASGSLLNGVSTRNYLTASNCALAVTGIAGQITLTTSTGFGGYFRATEHIVIENTVGGYHVYVLDASGVGVVKYSGAQSWSAYSDARIKNVHSALDNNLSKLENINPIYYSFNNFADDKNRIGLIAQEVQEYFPELVNLDPKTDNLTLDYTGLIPVLLGAIKELKKEIDILKAN